jgi:tRNA-modifying protein YgfZ
MQIDPLYSWTHVPDRALFRLTGSDRVRYLNGQITNDLAVLATGHACYAASLTGKGKIVTDLFIAAGTDALWLDAPLVRREALHERLEKFLIADDAVLEDVTDQSRVTHFFHHPPAPQKDRMIFANLRHGLPGYDCWTPAESTALVSTDPMVEPALIAALHLEYALGQWGREIDENTLPQEILLERHGLSYTKGCYVGQETVARIRSIGHVNKSLCCLEHLSGPIPALPQPLTLNEAVMGKLTSTGLSPTLNKQIALGLVSTKHQTLGTELVTGEARWKLIPIVHQIGAPRTFDTA